MSIHNPVSTTLDALEDLLRQHLEAEPNIVRAAINMRIDSQTLYRFKQGGTLNRHKYLEVLLRYYGYEILVNKVAA